MKQFLVFVQKEFLHVFRDRKSLLLLFGLPVAQIILFGFALTNEIRNAHIVVCDQSKDALSKQIIDKLAAGTYFDIEETVATSDGIEEAFRKGKVKLAVVFPESFANSVYHDHTATVQLIADGADPNTANTLIMYAANIIRDVPLEGTEQAIVIQPEVRMLYNPELKGATNFVPGVMALVLMIVCVLMTSVSIVREKETGTMEVLLVSPLHPIWVIASKVAPYFVVSLVNFTVILLLSVYLLDTPIRGSIALLFGVSCLYIITALSLGLLISNVTNTQQTAMFISLVGMLLPTVLLSGFMFPVENMPWPLQLISNIIPAKWYYIIVKDVMIKGLGFGAIWKQSTILFGMTTLLIAISLKKFKIRLE